jgi:5-methylthioadenosine/S-adenosylhomocysteine deaminase
VSETKQEVQDSLKQFGKSPVRRLESLGYLKHHSIFAHCVHLDLEEIQMLAKSKTGIIHNPESNMKLGSGVAPVRQMLLEGCTVGIGTDGAASNNDLNLFKEMDTAAKLQKLIHADNTAMTAIQALRMATREGAKALGLGDITGTLEVGKRADIIVIDPANSNMQPLHDIPSQLVYATTGTEVETVICDGQILMEEWYLLTLNRMDIFNRLGRYRAKNSL